MTIYQALKNSLLVTFSTEMKNEKCFKKSKTVEQNSSFQRFSRSLVTGVTTGSSPLPPGHIVGRLRWPD